MMAIIQDPESGVYFDDTPLDEDLMMRALAALVSARDFIAQKHGAQNPERNLIIADLCARLDVVVVPA